MANKYETDPNAIDVTERQKRLYENMVDPEDAERQKEVTKAWKKAKRIKKLTPVNVLLMLGVTAFVPWYIYQDRQDISYFFSSSTPQELGDAGDYHFAYAGEETKTQDFTDNSYVHIKGIPIRHVGIQVPGNPFVPNEKKLVYQLLGSSVYIQEDLKNSQYANFISQTSASLGAAQGISLIDVNGRLRRYDTADAKQYAPLRDYYAKTYDIQFCEDMSPDERRRKAAMLGHGGVALQIMPDGALIEGVTDTHVTLTDVTPLRGRAAMAVGSDNTLLHSIDAGLTWRKAELPVKIHVSSLAFEPESGQIMFAGKDGFVGSTSDQTQEPLPISQDIADFAFTSPEPGDTETPRIIAVGREGLIEIAVPGIEGWIPASLEENLNFNDICLADNTWFAVGSQNMLMHKSASSLDDVNVPWIRDVSPVKAEWLSLLETSNAVIATGTKGALATYDFHAEYPHWINMPVDDVPGISFDYNLNDSAISGDGKTWVGVGDKGAIVVAFADENGKFTPVQRISASYAGYGVVRDILAGNTVEQALYETLQRHTTEDLHGITWHNGLFYAVGSESLLMTSKDGLSWTKQTMHVKHKLLHTVAFTENGQGVIGGEKGIMFVTQDNGNTWRTKDSATERSIYHISTSPALKGGYVFSGAYGLWGFCKSTKDPCYLRARNNSFHYRAVVPVNGPQDAAHLNLIAVGDDSTLQHIQDAPGDGGQKHPLWISQQERIEDVMIAAEELPLMPNSARGHVGLISVGNGTIYRSMDGGFTFKREETGSAAPLRHVVSTADGTVVWAFDRQGNALEDVRGLAQYHPISPGSEFTDGIILGETGYLIDKRCIYHRAIRGGEIQKLACMEDSAAPGSVFSHIAVDPKTPNKLTLLLNQPGNLQTPYLLTTLSLSDTPQLSEPQPFDIQRQQGDAIYTPNPVDSRLISCNGTHVLWDSHYHMLFSSVQPQTEVSDIACIDGKLAVLSTQKEGENTWTLSAATDEPLWSVQLGFNPEQARFFRRQDGRWWISMPSVISGMPYILMSQDGKRWSWRRDRITDYHAVATAQNMAVAVGDNGEILVSDNAGKTWTQMRASGGTLRDVCLSSDGSFGLAVGDHGVIYRAQNGLTRWSKLKFQLDFDITSCTIAEQQDRFQVYLAGKGGAIYTSNSREMSRLELIASPVLEDLYKMTTLETGEVIAVGGVYQDPATLCEEGFIIEANETPRKQWPSILIALLLLLFWGYTLQTFVISWKHRNDVLDKFCKG